MIEDENTNALFGIRHTFQPSFQPLHDRSESVFLNEIEQSLFGFKVVIETRERHAALAREIAHGGAFVSLFTEHCGGVTENLGQPPVIACYRNGRCRAMTARGDSSCCARTPHTPRKQVIRTFVRNQYT